MEIVEWESGVNRVITNESSPSFGEDSIISNKSENGSEQTSLKQTSAPDVWTVVMYFSNSTEDNFYKNHNRTEWDAFINWFKYKTKFGTKPFYFNKIGKENESAIYKIRSNGLPKPAIMGTTMKVSMVWVEYNNTAITVPDVVVTGDYIDVSNGIIDFHFNEVPENFPQKSDFSAYYQNYNEAGEVLPAHTPIVIEKTIYDGNKTVQMYFQTIDEQGRIKVTIGYTDNQSETTYVYRDLMC